MRYLPTTCNFSTYTSKTKLQFRLRPLLFFFNDTATTEIYTLSLHDALPICRQNAAPTAPTAGSSRRDRQSPDRRTVPSIRSRRTRNGKRHKARQRSCRATGRRRVRDRKSTRLNSSHLVISYAVFCLKKKKEK